MTLNEMKAIIEGLLFVSGDEGIELKQIAEVLEINKQTALDVIDELQLDYEKDSRGMQIVEVAEAYQLTTKVEHAIFYKRLIEMPRATTLSQASLETLAIVAYKQPITRTEIEEIRGVKSDRPIQTIVAKHLIKEVGRVEGPGRPILYGTTKEFLEAFGLKTLKELPEMPEQVDGEAVVDEADLFFEKFQETFEDTKERE
ncbi:SMC-Scp complex subunit ScpB [Lottiidibacillus patelloidae]|uniref:Segregation and condensation protein B n=1 Tax=Lottiidibacillus patelloidae TaxID=2670334 RepID=A0A263BUA7_9BACI|nr:SMC-Scp complex subunit ScpB [Lottiidibacillus patelloidae]OZM57148.1 SMC-Scp complex subunit ScpB [Lottiidibacillus patelloidae]